MADLYLVRHGQASFGGPVYDKLSDLGVRQAALLGTWFAACAIRPDIVATGSPCRQIDTAVHCLATAGGPARLDWLLLDGLGEYDHDAIVARYRPDYADPAVMHAAMARTDNPRRAFHSMYVKAVARWVEGAHDDDYAESWMAFRRRVLGGLRELTSLEARTIIAFTSGGPITAIVQHLLGTPDERAFDANWPLVNAGYTKLRFNAGTGVVSLATFNAYPHLERAGDAGLVTFR